MTVLKRSSRSDVALTRSQQMVRVRRVVYQPQSAVYDIDQTQVGREHASALKTRVECDIAIHGGAAVTSRQYKQSAELKEWRRTGVERA